MLKSVQKLSTFKKCLKHYLLSDSVLVSLHLFYRYALWNLAILATETNKCDLIWFVWTHCIWYTSTSRIVWFRTVWLAVLPFFLCSFMFVGYLFFCVYVCVCECVCVFLLGGQRDGNLSFLATCHSAVCWLNCYTVA